VPKYVEVPRYKGRDVGVVPVAVVDRAPLAEGGIVIGPLHAGAVSLMHHFEGNFPSSLTFKFKIDNFFVFVSVMYLFLFLKLSEYDFR